MSETKTIRIDSLAYGGKGVGRIDGKVVFVPFSAPGDTARVRITADKGGFDEAVIEEVVEPSSLRVTPLCPVYERCGGCSIQHIRYDAQVELKHGIFLDNLKRIGKTVPLSIDPPARSAPFGYRARARFHTDGALWGFHEIRSHNIVDIVECPLASQGVNRAFKAAREALEGYKYLSLYSVEIASGSGGESAVFYVSEDRGFGWKGALKDTGLAGFEVRLAPLKRDKGRVILSEGETSVSYVAGGCSFTVPASGFSQVNRELNGLMVEKTLAYPAFNGSERVIDLFCGAGNLTLPVARKASSVLGVESSPESISEAAANASLNNIANAAFVRADARGWLLGNLKRLEKEPPDVVVLDPPRGGDPEAARALARVKPGRIVYVSCSPPTMARDISYLASAGYRLSRSGILDMFPQTYHIEGVAGLELF